MERNDHRVPASGPARALSSALASLHGLACGDAFGQQWFHAPPEDFHRRVLQPGPWYWTDDTAMAVVLVRELSAGRGVVDQDRLAAAFAAEYRADDHRGYGASMHDVLRRIGAGEDWRTVTREQFEGQGSFGNGAAMRVAPLGAWWTGRPERAAEEAARQAEVTHSHPEAVAGAVAVAVAAALVGATDAAGGQLLAEIADRTPDGEVRSGLEIASRFRDGTSPVHAATVLGNGTRISAPDTVPFSLWVAAHHRDDFTEALWTGASTGGDLDTVDAIVGGVLAAGRPQPLPEDWQKALEPLPAP
ncbi:hypothetical protein BIV57_09075 [Mangrovactinospora gilvigrisea]|uniref:Hydrolase n=1 Tax=Mangrovactinospora gilvigrisea TaxID=1428644 RepID=A0A1J7BGC2_9ACTN|nr:ADP-ribosylglycohydrolase family protein [Mangrovactinospora gilvigrisea]OIV37723.1 hypothetical protein BIV57_09075 [Mangrovactinospora gilvigrisea]